MVMDTWGSRPTASPSAIAAFQAAFERSGASTAGMQRTLSVSAGSMRTVSKRSTATMSDEA